MSRNREKVRRERELEQRRRQKRETRLAQSPRWNDVVGHARRLIERRDWAKARETLEAHERTNPGQPEILRLLMDVYHELGDHGPYCRCAERLLERDPANRTLHVMLAGGYFADMRVASSLLAFRRFVERWPDDPMADGARETMGRLAPAVEKLTKDTPFAPAEKLELTAMHEEVMACLSDGENARGIAVGERLLTRAPTFVPVMNNLSQLYYFVGRTSEAIAVARRVLELEPENFHGLANLALHLLLKGRIGEAEPIRERLRAARSNKSDLWCKQAETLSFFGDDQAVLDALAAADAAGVTRRESPDVGLLYHLAAVASARQGDYTQARRYWERAIKIRPDLRLAQKNLADARKPIGERQGPWAYTLDYWIPKTMFDRVSDSLARPAAGQDEEAAQQTSRRIMAEYPELATIVPELLDRGDPTGREFAVRIAKMCNTPEMLEALRQFCLGQRGPDRMRIQLASYLSCAGVLESGPVRLWTKGEWRHVEVLGFEVTREPIGECYCDEVNDWAVEGMEANDRDDGVLAERLFKQCLEVEPDKPDLLNNLAAAYSVQGRHEEAHDLVREIHRRWPDYSFGRIGMANLATQAKDHERAKEYLLPLLRSRRLHITEFTALAGAQCRLALAREDFKNVKLWLDMWRDIAPDDPNFQQFDSLCRPILKVKAMLAKVSGERQ